MFHTLPTLSPFLFFVSLLLTFNFPTSVLQPALPPDLLWLKRGGGWLTVVAELHGGTQAVDMYLFNIFISCLSWPMSE